MSIGILLILVIWTKTILNPNYKEFFLCKHNKNARISQCILDDTEIISKLQLYSKQKQCILMPYGITALEEEISEICGIHNDLFV